MSVFPHYTQDSKPQQELSYSGFLEQVKSGRVQAVDIQETNTGTKITGSLHDGTPFLTFGVQDDGMIKDLLDNNVEINGSEPESR
jgi:cell division protease FtsH